MDPLSTITPSNVSDTHDCTASQINSLITGEGFYIGRDSAAATTSADENKAQLNESFNWFLKDAECRSRLQDVRDGYEPGHRAALIKRRMALLEAQEAALKNKEAEQLLLDENKAALKLKLKAYRDLRKKS